jgi:secreted PhoX family phosphatase
MGRWGFGSKSGSIRLSIILSAAMMLMATSTAHSAGGSKPLNRPRGPALWVVSRRNNSVSEFSSKAIKHSGVPAASRILASADLNNPWGMIFDFKKNLWVSNVGTGPGNGTITGFTLAQLKALKNDGTPAAAIVISGLNRPEGMAFDRQNNLWVANEGNALLLEFTASQLQSSGSPTPSVTIDSADLESPVGLAIDNSGNLWVADDGFGRLAMFTKAQLATGGMISATVVLTNNGSGDLSAAEPLAFDDHGDLWVANDDDPVQNLGSVAEFTPGQLATSGSPTPAVMLTPTPVLQGATTSLDGTSGIAFDNQGNLWVGNDSSDQKGSVAKFSKQSIKSSGSPLPSVFLDSNGTNLNSAYFLAFGPKVP